MNPQTRKAVIAVSGVVFLLSLASVLDVDFPGFSHKEPKPPSPPLEIVCNPPYIRVGATCCLDVDENSICDKDEKWPKTTLPTTSTTTTVREKTGTTVRPRTVECTVNADCGIEKATPVCYNGDIYLKTESPYCTRPGTTYSRCIQKSDRFQDHPLQKCSRGCKDGACL